MMKYGVNETILESELDGAVAEIERLMGHIDGLMARGTQQEAEIYALKKERDEARAELESAYEEIARMKDYQAHLSAELRDLQFRVDATTWRYG